MRIREAMPTLFPAERKVASFLLQSGEDVLHLSIAALARQAGVSPATVVRFCQSLGFDGYRELKISLAQDLALGSAQKIHGDLHENDDAGTVLRKVFQGNIRTLQDTLRVVDMAAFQRATEAIIGARRIEVYAVGNSSPLALDLQYKFVCIGLCAVAYADPHMMPVAAGQLEAGDVAIGITHSGSSKETVEALARAREGGATTICLTNFARSAVVKVADIALFTAARSPLSPTTAIGMRAAVMTLSDALYANVGLRTFERSIRYITREEAAIESKKY